MLTLLIIGLVFVVPTTVYTLYRVNQLQGEANPEEKRKWEALRYRAYVKNSR